MRISPAEAHAKMSEGYTYVDVRSPEEFAEGRPAGAVNVNVADGNFVDQMIDRFPKDTKIILGCRSGNRSMRALRMLQEAGFTNLLEQRAGWDGARGSFGELSEPGWGRTDLPSDKG